MPQRKKTLEIVELLEKFPNEASARKWFTESAIVSIVEV